MNSKKMLRNKKWTRFSPLFALATAVAASIVLYIGCGPGFIGKNTRKPAPKKQNTESISPDETDNPGNGIPEATPSPDNSIVASGDGTVTGGPSIALTVIQTASESWWKNCLYAKTKQSTAWVPVSCNKSSSGVSSAGTGTVKLPAEENTCNQILLKIETFKNLGDTCSERKTKGLSCEGPYARTPDATRTPAASKNSSFRVYDSKTISNPDPIILANASWNLPDFTKLQADMVAFRGIALKNQWIRVFFEDKPENTVAKAVSGRAPNEAKALGVDFNDYVFDIKSQGVEFSIEGSPLACGP